MGYVLCLLIGFFVSFLIFDPRRVKRLQENEKIKSTNQYLHEENKKIREDCVQQQKKLDDLLFKYKSLQDNINESAEEYKKAKVSEAEIFVERETKKIEEVFSRYKAEYQQEYLELMATSAENFRVEIAQMAADKAQLAKTLDELRSSVNAAVETAKRDADEKNKELFYCINLSSSDLEEIKKLREIIPLLKNPEALNKVVWKVYYENPTSDLIGRIIGKDTKTGIYKITNLQNQMCYVGQAVDVGARWKQHIKRGIGAETPTRNKLYPAMQEFGLTSFTFELIEECDRNILDEREDFWQDFYHAKDYGYSIK